MKKVLITSVGSNVGGNFLLCLAHRRDEFYFIGTNTVAGTAFIFMCDEAHIIPPVSDEAAFEDAIDKLIRDHKPDLVVAGRDQDVSVLARMKEKNDYAATVFLVPSVASADISNDKYGSYLFAREAGLDFARSAVTLEDAKAIVNDSGYPLIAKPRINGHASKDVFIVRNDAELEASVADGGLVIQEMIGPRNAPESYDPISKCGVPLFFSYAISDQISCQALIGEGGEVLYVIASLNFYNFGRSHKYVPVGDKVVLDGIRAYAEALAKLGHFGPLNMQGKLDDEGNFVVYEINMRFTGATQGRTVLGWTEVEYAVDYIFDGKKPEVDMSPVGNVLAVREPFAYALEEAVLEEMTRTGHWKKR